MVSALEPPKIVSLPAPPEIESAPLWPSRKLSLKSPVIVSANCVPMRFSMFEIEREPPVPLQVRAARSTSRASTNDAVLFSSDASTVSRPLPPSTSPMFSCRRMRIRSSPSPPRILSVPKPPLRVSFPAPPSSVSFCDPPVRSSSPSPP